MAVCFIASASMACASFFVFSGTVNLGVWSLVPAILILVSVLQALIFRSYANGHEDPLSADHTAYSQNEIDKESYQLGMKWHYRCKLAIIPVLILFIIFFPPLYKVIVSVAVYAVSYLPVKLFVRLEKNKTDQ